MKFRSPIAFSLALVMASCSAAQVKEEAYTPSHETLRIKSDMPVVGIYDRWEDKSDSRYLVDGKSVIATSDLVTLLSDDPSAEVVSNMNAYKTWTTVESYTGGFALAFALIAPLGYIHDKEGQRAAQISTINAFWILAAALGTVAVTSHFVAEKNLRDAVPIHNDHIQPGGAAVSWAVHF